MITAPLLTMRFNRDLCPFVSIISIESVPIYFGIRKRCGLSLTTPYAINNNRRVPVITAPLLLVRIKRSLFLFILKYRYGAVRSSPAPYVIYNNRMLPVITTPLLTMSLNAVYPCLIINTVLFVMTTYLSMKWFCFFKSIKLFI